MTGEAQLGLWCRGLTKSFGSGRGLFDVSLRVAPGSVYALLGGNGAGKTTLINLLLGYLAPDAGETMIDGIDVARDPVAAKERIAYVPEVARLYPHLSAIENIRFFERLMGRERTGEEIASVLATLNFPRTAAGTPVQTYSKGMRQKTVIAMGLLKGAGVFLLDEPTSGLDPGGVATFAQLVVTLKRAGKAILFSSHDLQSVYASADLAGVLHRGRLIVEEPVERLRQRDVGRLFELLQDPDGIDASGIAAAPLAPAIEGVS